MRKKVWSFNRLSVLELMTPFWCLYCYLWTYFTAFLRFSIVNFKQVIFCWGTSIFIELISIFSMKISQFYICSSNEMLTRVLYWTYFGSLFHCMCKFEISNNWFFKKYNAGLKLVKHTFGVTTEQITSTTKDIKTGPNHSSVAEFVILHGML